MLYLVLAAFAIPIPEAAVTAQVHKTRSMKHCPCLWLQLSFRKLIILQQSLTVGYSALSSNISIYRIATSVSMPSADKKPQTLYDKVFQDHIVDERDDGTILLYIGME